MTLIIDGWPYTVVFSDDTTADAPRPVAFIPWLPGSPVVRVEEVSQ